MLTYLAGVYLKSIETFQKSIDIKQKNSDSRKISRFKNDKI